MQAAPNCDHSLPFAAGRAAAASRAVRQMPVAAVMLIGLAAALCALLATPAGAAAPAAPRASPLISSKLNVMKHLGKQNFIGLHQAANFSASNFIIHINFHLA
ncbi:hypothetical protein [Burkholderia glumae]|uniref:hypothetical protein n=1 Tax=Burkholderia glumae TaxID=337 RepID=UPI00265D862A|nr:hypothetical protein [Burkholderia glumae]